MTNLVKLLKSAYVGLFTILSVVSWYQWQPTLVRAADCTAGAPTQLAIYSTNLSSPYLRPDTTLDPQTVMVGQQSVNRLEVELEDANACPVVAASTVHYTLSTTGHAVDFITTGGVNRGESYSYWISAGSSRSGFFVLGKNTGGISPYSATITATDTDLSPYVAGVQTVTITTPVVDVSKLVFTNNTHGVSDTVSGSADAVVRQAVVPAGVMVKLYTPVDANTWTLAGTVAANADGSFPPLLSGDDQYRQVKLTVVYPGNVESAGVIFTQNYPAIITNLHVVHDFNTVADFPKLTWMADSAAVRYAIFRRINQTGLNFVEIGNTTNTTYLDQTALLGVPYMYTVKAIDLTGSYTPEFVPTVAIRLDVSRLVVTPAFINASSLNSPVVNGLVSGDVASLWSPGVNNDPVSGLVMITFTNTSGAVYYATVSLAGAALTGDAPFVDQNRAVVSLPDGVYNIKVLVNGSVAGRSDINDEVTVTSTYRIDVLAPQPPVLAKLRYSNNVLFGLAGSVEGGSHVLVYDNVLQITPVADVIAGQDGSFNAGTLSVPVGGIFYLRALDEVGNLSSAALFDVMSVPLSPVASRLYVQQNPLGTADMVIGLPGAVPGGAVVRIYAINPNGDVTFQPLFETVAASDGSFQQAVGDNLYATLYVAVWSGANLLSPAVPLTNTVSVAAPITFRASVQNTTITLTWSSVSNAHFYTITATDLTSDITLAPVVVLAPQTVFSFVGSDGHQYRFALTVTDQYGNVSPAVTTTAAISLPKPVAAVSTTKPTPVKISQATPTPTPAPTEVAASPSPSESSAPAASSRNWTNWILGAGILILLIALLTAYLVWGKPTETTVTMTPKTPPPPAPKSKPATKPAADKTPKEEPPPEDQPPRPRW